MPDVRRWWFDTVVLSNFALSRRLDLLVARYGTKAVVPSEVLAEISEGIAAGHEDLNAVTAAVTQGDLDSCDGMSAAERAEFQGLLRSLGAGEAACIARAHARGGIVVTDDRAARTACGERGIACTGTIGILKACCDDGQLGPDDADLALSRMVDAGFYAPVFRISDLL